VPPSPTASAEVPLLIQSVLGAFSAFALFVVALLAVACARRRPVKVLAATGLDVAYGRGRRLRVAELRSELLAEGSFIIMDAVATARRWAGAIHRAAKARLGAYGTGTGAGSVDEHVSMLSGEINELAIIATQPGHEGGECVGNFGVGSSTSFSKSEEVARAAAEASSARLKAILAEEVETMDTVMSSLRDAVRQPPPLLFVPTSASPQTITFAPAGLAASPRGVLGVSPSPPSLQTNSSMLVKELLALPQQLPQVQSPQSLPYRSSPPPPPPPSLVPPPPPPPPTVGYDSRRCRTTGKLRTLCACSECLTFAVAAEQAKQANDAQWAHGQREARQAELHALHARSVQLPNVGKAEIGKAALVHAAFAAEVDSPRSCRASGKAALLHAAFAADFEEESPRFSRTADGNIRESVGPWQMSARSDSDDRTQVRRMTVEELVHSRRQGD